MKREDAIQGFKRILAGEFDHIGEQLFYLAGGIEEVLERYEKESKS